MDPFTEHAVLVYGPRKAGTTLLQNLLDGGGSIMMVPDELKLKFIVNRLRKTGGLDKTFFFSQGRSTFRNGLELFEENGRIELEPNSRFRFGNISREELDGKFDVGCYIAGLNALANDPGTEDPKEIYARDIHAFRASLREDRNYCYWASKEVGGDPAAVMGHFKGIFANTKFVFIARDPRMVVRSIILRRRRKGTVLSSKAILREVYQAQRVIDYYGAIPSSSDHMLVFYEDLARDTRGEMKRVAAFLEVPFEPVFENPTLFGLNVKVRTASRDSKAVFQEKTNWKKGLTLREKIAVTGSRAVLGLRCRIAGSKGVPYGRLRDRAASSSHPPAGG